ncbi:hypothetical protein PFISCL1PPCAC_28870 [Pristionchus fissidentatus]|uniref:Uncharacterized protein n=1 Tax=Pristionchus fissidentatus TaxID=1538716 RepID=A0AAV5X3X3_9BILA|nr:hypothetical protein PFISCL1PPCAC_28870 [Pristionchus fissidentatus]
MKSTKSNKTQRRKKKERTCTSMVDYSRPDPPVENGKVFQSEQKKSYKIMRCLDTAKSVHIVTSLEDSNKVYTMKAALLRYANKRIRMKNEEDIHKEIDQAKGDIEKSRFIRLIESGTTPDFQSSFSNRSNTLSAVA